MRGAWQAVGIGNRKLDIGGDARVLHLVEEAVSGGGGGAAQRGDVARVIEPQLVGGASGEQRQRGQHEAGRGPEAGTDWRGHRLAS